MTVLFASAVPEMITDLVLFVEDVLIVIIGAIGGVTSTVTVIASEESVLFPAASMALAVMTCLPSVSGFDGV